MLGLDVGDGQAAIVTVALQRLGMIDQVRQRITGPGMGDAFGLHPARSCQKLRPVGHRPRLALFILVHGGQVFDVAFEGIQRFVPVQALLGDRTGRLVFAQSDTDLVETAPGIVITQHYTQVVAPDRFIEVGGTATHQRPQNPDNKP
jgi:hypothetical protein